MDSLASSILLTEPVFDGYGMCKVVAYVSDTCAPVRDLDPLMLKVIEGKDAHAG